MTNKCSTVKDQFEKRIERSSEQTQKQYKYKVEVKNFVIMFQTHRMLITKEISSFKNRIHCVNLRSDF